MKINYSVIFFTILTLLGLLTTVVFQKGISTSQTITQDALKFKNNMDTAANPPSNTNKYSISHKITYLENQIKQLSQQQNSLVHNLEKLLFKLPDNAATCPPSIPAKINKGI